MDPGLALVNPHGCHAAGHLQDAAGLLAAYLRDQRVGPVQYVEVKVVASRLKEKAESNFDQLSTAARRAALDKDASDAILALIRAIPNNPKLRRVVMNVADMANELQG